MSRPSEFLGEAEFGADRPVAAALRTRDVPGVNNQLEGRRLSITRQAFDRAISCAAGLGALLVLRGEHVRGDPRLQRLDIGGAQAARIERLARLPPHDRPIPVGVIFRFFGNQRQLENKISGRLYRPRKIVGRQSMHDQDEGAFARIVETRVDRAVDPVAQLLLHPLGERVLGLDRIVDDDLVGAEAGDVAADGGGIAISAHGGADMVDGALVEDRSGKN